ncbi:MAG TPA: lamin tail domain-containing protein [Kofleriaceae bacterium]|nr:lamin tail domain-containing protein [Kofleriaceae bacterium]
MLADRSIAAAAAAAAALACACGPAPPAAVGCTAGLGPGDLVITEVFADARAAGGSSGIDTGREWFEIYNATGDALDLSGLAIRHSRPDGSRPSAHTIGGGARIAAGQFFTLGSAAPGAGPAYLDYDYGADLGGLFNTEGGRLALACGDDEIDQAVYGDVVQGHARELSAALPPDYTLNDDPLNWCQADAAEFEAGNFGTPGADNDCRPVAAGQCRDPDGGGAMRRAVPPGPGDLVITELMPSPRAASDEAGEWFEARAMRDVDLNGVALRRAAGHASDVLASADCLRVRAGSHVVFARSADPAASRLPAGVAIAGTFRFNLVAGSAASPGDVAIVAGTTVVDAVTWTRSTAGAALQLDPARVDPAANDLESNFCDATAPYGGGDLGTPGAANPPCPALPGPGMCADDGGALRPIVPPAAGQLAISELLANPANVPGATDATREWFEVANTGAAAFDLNELRAGRIGAPGAPVQSARCLSVPSHGFAVFARSADPDLDGQLPVVHATFGFGLVDSDGDIQIARGDTVLDAVRWSSVTAGIARQLDPGHLSPADNDDPGNFCAATAPYGDQTNRGTPGAANRACP